LRSFALSILPTYGPNPAARSNQSEKDNYSHVKSAALVVKAKGRQNTAKPAKIAQWPTFACKMDNETTKTVNLRLAFQTCFIKTPLPITRI
jgi:hypothetical protein